MTSADILHMEFELLKRDLVKRYDELGMRASGKFENELEVQVSESGSSITATLDGAHYTKQLVDGRRPGAFPPIQEIEQWIIDKGIQPIEEDLTTSTLAFLIARKIAREGTKYFQNGGTDLVDSVVTPQRIQSIIDKVSDFNVTSFVDGLTEELRKIAA